VAVFRGLPQNLGPVDLASLDHTTGVLLAALPPADRDSVRAGIVVDSSAQAMAKVAALRDAACGTIGTPTTSTSPTPGATATAGPSATPLAGPTAGPSPSSSIAAQPTPTGSVAQASPPANTAACVGAE
jgi:PPM family protein phosphatase